MGLFARLRPGEGRAVLYFMGYGFLVMLSYYMLKTLREPLLLSKATAETKSYAYAAIALVLLFVVPAYGGLYRRLPRRTFNLWIFGLLFACGWASSISWSWRSSGPSRRIPSISKPASGCFP